MPKTSADGTADRLVDALWDFWRQWRMASHPVVKGRITPGQHWLLRRLMKSGPLPVSELARGINVTKASATTATKRLERMGFVRRERQQTDQRVVLVSLTEQGSEALGRWRAEQRSALLELLSRLSAEEQASLLGTITKILEPGE